MSFLRKIGYKNSSYLSGYLSKIIESIISKTYLHPMFIAALFITAKIWKQQKCLSTDEWVKKL
jgi:hypothetical protein